MFTATLIADPSRANLDQATLDALCGAWGGGDARWLNPNVAAEFSCDTVPRNAAEAWEGLQGLGVDLVVQPSAGRRKKMLLADMDSTMIQQECIDELADVAGVGARVKEITARAMNGELDFEGALTERVGLLKGLPDSVIREVIETRISFMPGGHDLLATMKANGAYCALVSGGFTAFTGHVAKTLGFEGVYNLNLALGPNGSGRDVAAELAHAQIEGTGSIAFANYSNYLILSNSGPFIRKLTQTYLGRSPGINSLENFEFYEKQLGKQVNGVVYLNGPQLDLVLQDYEVDNSMFDIVSSLID